LPSGKKGSGRDGSLSGILEGVDFLDLWNDKMFLGEEFLTWLYLASEAEGGTLRLPSGEAVELFFESSLKLSAGQGPSKRSVAITTPPEPSDPDWGEAYAALENRKKVTRGTIRVKSDGREWRMSLPSDSLSPQGVKLSAVKDAAESDDLGQAGLLLDRVGLVAELLDIVEALFAAFLEIRLSTAWETDELPRMERHIAARRKA
jgi:recombination associated protein RdgC